MGCFSGRLISSASGQKLFCEVCSAFKCSSDEFVGEKVVSLSYFSTILALPEALAKMLTVMVPILINKDVFEPKIINNFIFIDV